MYKTVTEFLKAKVSLFKGLSEARILEIVKASRVVYYEVNEPVIRLGEEATFLGVVLEGELKIAGVTEDGFQRQVGFFSKGDTFGEMALMSRERIIADLIASKPCKILRIPVEVFQSVLM
ncbi:MAG: cyclic nucleotide-binding domain-containing protein, partial [Prolixibacteraceae bacterium]|nr:cyclic nucleotide-binding domain-containing protein [Prolixibacteraceae bacterium]